MGLQDCLWLGNLDAKRDWGHASDYVKAMWLMLQQEEPRDFVIATGEQHSVREFLEAAAQEAGIEMYWKGSGVKERAYRDDGQCIVRIDPRYFRPSEVETLMGDSSHALEQLGWRPTYQFSDLVAEMMHEDLKKAEREMFEKRHGYTVPQYHE